MNTPRLLRLRQVIEITALGRDTIYRYIRAGQFPRQRRISERASAWREDEIKEWVDSRPIVELNSETPQSSGSHRRSRRAANCDTAREPVPTASAVAVGTRCADS
ncbi:helix-turn-helix transcriptional regulator [Peristeroidobacter soli]|uniref:helix-turn-helix transcriptional regulator n=1 Tax=Peristeroidobacter soli TaxID=2497877 RepID=UPI001C3790E1